MLTVVILVFICCISAFVSPVGSKGLIVVPGLGRADRLQTVVHNLKLLEKNYIHGKRKWDCIIYVYAPRSEVSFWAMQAELSFVRGLCLIVENPGKLVTENLYMLQPALIRDTYSRIFILLDDCKLGGEDSFDLWKLTRAMKQNNLTVVSPLISGANKGGGQAFRNIMQTEALPGTAGYVSSFVEIFVWLLTLPAYEALWELLCPSVNPYAWGYDFWYDGYARGRVPGHRMGLLSSVVVRHEQNTAVDGAGRTDNTAVGDKWKAVLAQERHYKQHLGVDLRHFRDHLDIANTSWNGAVKGFLLPLDGPPPNMRGSGESTKSSLGKKVGRKSSKSGGDSWD